MIVDVVDRQNRVVDRAQRSSLLKRHLNFRTVHVLLFDGSGRLILQKLAPHHPRSPGRLGSTVAGYLFSGESYLAAARRRMRAELEITARLKRIGQFEMNDEGSRKFVRAYAGLLIHPPTIRDPLVVGLEHIKARDLRRRIGHNSSEFTATFVTLYEHLAERLNQWTHSG